MSVDLYTCCHSCIFRCTYICVIMSIQVLCFYIYIYIYICNANIIFIFEKKLCYLRVFFKLVLKISLVVLIFLLLCLDCRRCFKLLRKELIQEVLLPKMPLPEIHDE